MVFIQGRLVRVAATVASVGAVAALCCPATALAVDPPVIDPGALPAGDDGPEVPMRQNNGACTPVFARDGSQFTDPPWASDVLRLGEARSWSQGQGVLVAIIDTGVNPSARVPAEPGGDFVEAAGDGLSDCDMHGSVVAAVIAGRPRPDDGFVGVAPQARLLSIRNASHHFSPTPANRDDPNGSDLAVSIRTLARAVVRAADAGARVINISEDACVKLADRVDQQQLGAAIRYAAIDKDAVIVVAAGNTDPVANLAGSCTQNSPPVPSNPSDPLGWGQVQTVVTPAWFSPLVLPVGALGRDGAPAALSMAGPWMGVTAPGVDITGLADDHPVDSYAGRDGPTPIQGTSFASGFVAGVAALVRAKFPDLTAAQVRDRITRTARHPGPGWNGVQGYGAVDPVAALTWDVPVGPRSPQVRVKPVAAPQVIRPADRGPITWVGVLSAAAAGGAGLVWLIRRADRNTKSDTPTP